MCVKDINRCMTTEAERVRLDAGYGQYEFEARMEEVRSGMLEEMRLGD
jgi:hypothetical protein